MKFQNKDIKLAIFDLDGTLVDSTSLWSDVDKKFFNKRGMELPSTYAKEIAHIGLNAAAKLTKEKYFPNENIKDILKEWEDLSLEAYEKEINLKNNAKELIEFPCLKRLEIYDYFSFIIDVNSCKEGKDSPEIFDKACEYFNVSRDEAIIFEDSLQALKTTFLAGYNVIAVYDKNSTKDIEKTKKYSHLLINDFDEIINELKL